MHVILRTLSCACRNSLPADLVAHLLVCVQIALRNLQNGCNLLYLSGNAFLTGAKYELPPYVLSAPSNLVREDAQPGFQAGSGTAAELMSQSH